MEMLIHNFLEYLELIGKSKRTISEYALDLRVFLSFFGGQHSRIWRFYNPSREKTLKNIPII